ncbi:MAG: uncharacterized membrane protein YgdD (TMEM256/DUF423 family) [Myxococcota bacterium]|jgi:uncharacterized membrane protein YgdD (TMEM256/DUF423 family)
MWWTIAGVVGALGVALGAFGAHGLKGVVTDPHLLEVWETAARYHLIHAVALLGVAAHPARPALAGWLMVAGIVVFSGSLYTMTLTGQRWLGAITPIGGLCFIAGWLALGFARST